MKMIESLVPLLVMYVVISDTAGEPCSTAYSLPVVNICTDVTKIQDVSNSVIIKVDSRQNCTCELSVINQDKAISVNFQKYGQEISSSPSAYGCGLIVMFGSGRADIIWVAECIVSNTIRSNSININDVMIITSLTVKGTLKPDEGYCFEISKVNDSWGNKFNLTCGISRTTAYSTDAPITETTRLSTEITNPRPSMSRRTTEHQLTTVFDSDELISTTVTSTDVTLTTQQTYQQERFRMLTQRRNRTCSGSNTIYDTLRLPSPVNGAENASISNNYSSLNINVFQSSYDNKILDGLQSISLSTISTVQGNNTNVQENEKSYENTNKWRSDYANLVFQRQ